MYCGDETAALVGDLGSRTFKFGFAGEDMPKGWIPSCIGKSKDQKLKGLNSLLSCCEDVDVKWIKENGRVQDWDDYCELWEYAVETVLSSDAKEHPIMASCSTYETKEDRVKMTEAMFEKLQPFAYFQPRNAMLSGFSLGRASALIVDVGGPKTCAAAIHDGYVLNKSICLSEIAADYVNGHIIKTIESGSKELVTPLHVAANAPAGDENEKDAGNAGEKVLLNVNCMLSKKKSIGESIEKGTIKPQGKLKLIKASYIDWQKLEVVNDLRVNICRIWSELNFERKKAYYYAKEKYELPDGTIIYMGAERFVSGELLIDPYYDEDYFKETKGALNEENKSKCQGLPSRIKDCLQSTDVDLRKDIVQQIILVGGGSILPGTIERVTKELTQVLPSALKPRFLTPGKYERIFSTFTGASIFASLGSAQQLWVSKQEYEEEGAARIVQTRFIQ